MKSDQKALDSNANLIQRLQYTDFRTGILTADNNFAPARVIEHIKNCDPNLLSQLGDRFNVIYSDRTVPSDGVAVRSIEAHIVTCVENGFITNAVQGKAYLQYMLASILQPLLQIDIDEANSSKSIREEKISAYMKTLDDSLKDIIIKKESFMSVKESTMPDPSVTTIFHPIAQQAMVAEGLSPPNQTTLMRSIQLFKNNMSTTFAHEAITKGISDELTNKYNRLNMLIDESLNIINAYKIKQPVNLEKLKALTELTNALQAICNLPPEAINSESITPITNQLRTNLLVTYEDILESEQLKSPGFDAKSSSTLRNIATALQKDEKLVPPQIKRTSFSASERPAVKPAGLVKSTSNIVPAPQEPTPELTKTELRKELLGVGDGVILSGIFCYPIDTKLDVVQSEVSLMVRSELTKALELQVIFDGNIVEPDGEIIAIVRSHIDAAIESGVIATIEDGNQHIATYSKMVIDRLSAIIKNSEKFKEDWTLVNGELEQMKREVMQPVTALKIKASFITTPLSPTVFHPDTQIALTTLITKHPYIKHPAPTFLTKVNLFKNNLIAQLSLEISTQGFSDELINKYNRLNMLIDESLKIINSYQAKQPVNLEKLNAIVELANALEAICNQPKAINSDSITPITDQLRTNLTVTYEHILQAEKDKGLLAGFRARSSSTLGNINTALQEDEKLISQKTKNASFSANEKPIAQPEELTKSATNIMPDTQKTLNPEELLKNQEELLKKTLGNGSSSAFASWFFKDIDMHLDSKINPYSAKVRESLSAVLDEGLPITPSGTAIPDGKIVAIIKNSITEAIKSGEISSAEEGVFYAKRYQDVVKKHLQQVTATDECKKNPDLVTTKIIEPMEREVIQTGKLLKLRASLMSAPLTTVLFLPATQKAMAEKNYPDQISLMGDVQQFKNNMAKQFFSEASTQGFSDELANKYIRLNKLIEESLKIISSYQAKQPVNIEKLKALAELTSALQAICNQSPNAIAINSESITPITNQLRDNLSTTKDNIIKAETSKSNLTGFIARSSSTVGNISAALKQDEKLMSPETKKTFLAAKEKPIVKELVKSATSFFRR